MARRRVGGKRAFAPMVRYELEVTVAYGPVPDAELWAAYRDGRRSGLLNEKLLKALFNNLAEAPSARTPYDFLDDGGNRYEVRTVTARGASLVPSRMVGVGRKVDAEQVGAWRRTLDFFVFVDVRRFPEVAIVGVPEAATPARRRLAPAAADDLFKLATRTVRLR